MEDRKENQRPDAMEEESKRFEACGRAVQEEVEARRLVREVAYDRTFRR